MIPILILTVALSAGADDGLRRAERLLEEGRTDQAESLLRSMVEGQRGNASAHRLLGDVYRRQHRLAKARREYEQALRLDPADAAAKGRLASVEARIRPELFLAAGEWEPDSSNSAGWQAAVSYAGLDRLETRLAYGYSDKYFYTRRSLQANAYRFFSPTGYVKGAIGHKTYDYPVAVNPVPDANAYESVPSFEIEVAEDLSPRLRASAAYEFYRPTFFFAPDTRANNHKLAGELSFQPGRAPIRLRILTALLRDPDPAKTVIDRPSATVVNLAYSTQLLLGGGAEASLERGEAYALVIPNRDLDRSTDLSLLTGLAVDVASRVRVRADYIFDHYSSQSVFSGQTAHVFTGTLRWRRSARFEAAGGYKLARRPVRNDSGPFLSVRFRP